MLEARDISDALTSAAAAFEIEGIMVDGPNGPYDFLADVCTGQWLGYATLDQHPFGKFAGFNEDDNKMDMSATAADLELNGGPSLEECSFISYSAVNAARFAGRSVSRAIKRFSMCAAVLEKQTGLADFEDFSPNLKFF